MEGHEHQGLYENKMMKIVGFWSIDLGEMKIFRGGLRGRDGLGVVNYLWGERIEACVFFVVVNLWVCAMEV